MSYRYPSPTPGTPALIFGVGLPAVAILIELLTGWCAGAFFDPLPTFGHLLIVLVVPVVNLMLWMTARDAVAGSRWLAVATGVSLAIAGTYTLLLLPILPIATLAIIVLGVGLLAYAPLVATILSVRWAMAIDWGGSGGRLVAAGVVAGLAIVSLADLPATAVHLAINRYDGSDTDRASAVRLVRRVGDREMLRRIAYGDSARATGLVGAFASAWSGRVWSGDATRSDDARELYYRVTGEPYNARPKPADGLAARRDWFVSDPDLGGERVGARVAGLSLATSRIDGSVAAADNLAYVEWTVEIANAAAIQNEARFTLAMPEGAVASRATLWVDGTPREASVAGRAEVRAAYEKVVRANRDPLLVTTDGAGRLLVQAFPIAPGGTMRLRIGYTAPLVVAADGRRTQSLPAIVERNFEIAPDLKHAVWIDGDAPLTSGDRALHAAGTALRGGLADADLSATRSAFAAPRLTAPAVRVGMVAGDAKQAALAVEQRIARSNDDARALTILLDGSAPMARAGAALSATLDALPAGLPVGLVIAADDPVVIAPRPWSPAQRTAVAGAIAHLSYRGGQDDLSPLADAIAQASVSGGRVLWVHGAQPVAFARSKAALEQVLARTTTLPALIRYQAEPGRAFTITGDPLFDTARMVAPSGDATADLRAIFAGLTGPQWRTSYRPVPGAGRGSAHIVGLWAAHDLAGQGKTAGKARGKAVLLARQLNLITPVSGAVVLDTDREYRADGLPVPSADDVPTIPEPETWALLAILAVCAAWLLRRPQLRFA